MDPRKAFFVLFILLTGCATTANYEAILQTWIGSTEMDLISKWGPPQQVYEATGGVKYLTYQDSRSGYVPGTSPTYYTTYNNYTNTATTTSVGGSSGYSYTKSCQTTFEIRNGYITSWRWKGNACRAY